VLHFSHFQSDDGVQVELENGSKKCMNKESVVNGDCLIDIPAGLKATVSFPG
jgi:hypothetical protein